MARNSFIELLKKAWHFIWEDDSPLSWAVNILLAFILIKFLVYPALGFVLGTNYPVVAVVSSSMEHRGQAFDTWWDANKAWYVPKGITKEMFQSYSMDNGFNMGDIIILRGRPASDIKVGDIMVFKSHALYPKADPIIHRVVKIEQDKTGHYLFQTKGDNNQDSINNYCDAATKTCIDEYGITEDRVMGLAVFRIPLLGYIKIWAFNILGAVVTFVSKIFH